MWLWVASATTRTVRSPDRFGEERANRSPSVTSSPGYAGRGIGGRVQIAGEQSDIVRFILGEERSEPVSGEGDKPPASKAWKDRVASPEPLTVTKEVEPLPVSSAQVSIASILSASRTA